MSTSSSFDVAAYKAQLHTQVIGQRIDVHTITPSTMTLADQRMREEGAATAHGSVILAEAQSGGVGRRGRGWLSAPGNLYFSLLWAPLSAIAAAGGPTNADIVGPAALLPHLTQLNLAASVAVVRAAASVGVPSARIKWPNDVWAGEPTPRKLSGTILNFDGKSAAVLGVGINVLEDLTSNKTATSLISLGGDKARSGITREAVLAAFCAELERLMQLPAAAVLDEYRRYDLLRGRTLRVHHRTREEDDPRDFEAEAIGVDEDGQLRVRSVDGTTERSLSGEEVSITPNLGTEKSDCDAG
jgi:BirA family biotin operon repressor/biotin-[acetyl-CoA-carboxylase] ligase